MRLLARRLPARTELERTSESKSKKRCSTFGKRTIPSSNSQPTLITSSVSLCIIFADSSASKARVTAKETAGASSSSGRSRKEQAGSACFHKFTCIRTLRKRCRRTWHRTLSRMMNARSRLARQRNYCRRRSEHEGDPALQREVAPGKCRRKARGAIHRRIFRHPWNHPFRPWMHLHISRGSTDERTTLVGAPCCRIAHPSLHGEHDLCSPMHCDDHE